MSPMAPARPCAYSGCRTLVRGAARCPEHQQQERCRLEERRGSAASRGYGYRWYKARRAFLAHSSHMWCAICGFPTAAVEVDHIRPHRGDARLFWDQRNWQGICKSCHSRKTATEGRWG